MWDPRNDDPTYRAVRRADVAENERDAARAQLADCLARRDDALRQESHDWDELRNERDSVRAQLAAATARVAVLEEALTFLENHPGADMRLVTHYSDPLAAAVARVVAAALSPPEDTREALVALGVAVNAFRALAPWWPS